MSQDRFFKRLVQLWTTSMVPLTKANVVAYTGASLKKVDALLDGLTTAGTIEMDVQADGTVVWKIPAMRRNLQGAYHLADLQGDAEDNKRSMVLSTALSFFFGPLGWLYAAPTKVAVPGSIAYVLMCSLLPKAILTSVLGVSAPVTALLGAAYAWNYNRNGRRTPLLGDEGPSPKALPPR